METERKPKGYWTKERCQEEALKYNTRKDFIIYCKSAYSTSLNNNWLNDICIHMGKKKHRESKYNYDICQTEALKYKTKTDFQKHSSGIYKFAFRTKILNDICSHMNNKINKPPGYWTYEKCKEISLTCETKEELYKKFSGAYKVILDNDWLEEMCSHIEEKQKGNGYWTYDRCKEEALKYETKINYLKNSSSYKSAYRNNWLDEICSHMIESKKPNRYWSYDRCKEEALKYETKTQFNEKCSSAYSTVKYNNWTDELCSHMIVNKKPNGYWTKELCQQEALMYDTKSDYLKHSKSSHSAHKNRWINDICSHMPEIKKPNGYWSLELCKEEALKYEKKSEFKYNNSSAYSVSIENGWLKEICSHMKEIQKPNGYWTKELCQEESIKYTNKTEFKVNSSSAYNSSFKHGWLDDICSHMEIIGNRFKRCIYVYEFQDNYAYIGLTYNINKRNCSHMKNGPVFNHIQKTNLKPKLIKLTEYIDVEDAIKLEGEFVEKYKNNKWSVLNKSKTGAIGGNIIKWTYEKCEEVSKLCKNVSEYQKKYSGAYGSSSRNNWISIFFPKKKQSN